MLLNSNVWWSTTAETVKFQCKSSFFTNDGSREASVHGVSNYDENSKVMSSRENNVKSRTLNELKVQPAIICQVDVLKKKLISQVLASRTVSVL